MTGMIGALPAAAQNAPTTTPGDRVPATTQAPGPVVALATDQSNQVQDIVVTAQRRSEKLQDVPIAVTALDQQSLLASGIQGASELGKAVPGLVFNKQLGGLGQPRIRGVGVSASGPGLENPVAIYIDGIYYASASGALFDLKDVAQVALLKGPQGTLFGRNATGGLIQVTTKDPSHDFTLDLDGTVGTRDIVGANLYVTGGLTNTLAAGLSLNLDNQARGFGINIPTGQDVQTHHSVAGRGKLLFEPDASTRFTLSGDYSRRRSSDFAERVLGAQSFTGLVSPGTGHDTNETKISRLYSRQYGFTLNGQHEYDGVRLVSITGYRDTVFSSAFDGEHTPLNLINITFNEYEKQYSQELQLLSTGHGPFSWQTGVYYFDGTGKFDPNTTETLFPNARGIVEDKRCTRCRSPPSTQETSSTPRRDARRASPPGFISNDRRCGIAARRGVTYAASRDRRGRADRIDAGQRTGIGRCRYRPRRTAPDRHRQ